MNCPSIAFGLFLFSTQLLSSLAAQPPSPAGQFLEGQFLENQGQWPAAALFRTVSPAGTSWFGTNGIMVDLPPAAGVVTPGVAGSGVVLRMHLLEGAAVRPAGENRLSGRHHFIQKQNRVTDVAAFGRLRYAGVYPGIDLIVRDLDTAKRGGLFEYDFELRPGADLAAVRVRWEGIERLRIEEGGWLRMETARGVVRQTPPITWETSGGGDRVPHACRFVLLDEVTYGFAVPEWNGENPLTIDPGLILGTYIGGGANDGLTGVARNGNTIVVVGQSASTDYPTTAGSYQTTNKGNGDCVVSRFDASGNHVFSTYVGGSGNEVLNAVALAAGDQIVATGYSSSSDFPVTAGVVQSKFGGYNDVVALKLSNDGKSLIFATYLGGSRSDQGFDVHVDAAQVVTVVGVAAVGFPTTTGAFQTTMPSGNNFFNPFVTRLKPDAKSFVYSTYVGGTNYGHARGVDVDTKGQVTLGGQTGSPNFPTTPGAYLRVFQGPQGPNFMGFVARLDAAGTKLVWSTFLGGAKMDTVSDLEVHDNGDVTACGWTLSSGFPVTANAYQPLFAGAGGPATGYRGDGFASRLDAAGAKLLASTFLGGSGMDECNGMWLDPAGNVVLIGNTGSRNFPTTKGADRTLFVDPGFPTWVGEAWIARLDPSHSELIYCSFYGGSYLDYGNSVCLDAGTLFATFAGTTLSNDLTLGKNPFQKSLGGISAGYLAQIEMLPFGVQRVGASVPCKTPMFLEPVGMAEANDANFRVLVSGAPASSTGFLLVSPKALSVPVPLPLPLGSTLLLDPNGSILVGVGSAADGTATLRLPLTGIPKGAKGYLQTFWANNSGCTSGTLLSSSFAIEVDVQ